MHASSANDVALPFAWTQAMGPASTCVARSAAAIHSAALTPPCCLTHHYAWPLLHRPRPARLVTAQAGFSSSTNSDAGRLQGEHDNPQAALLVIGDEILSGSTVDTNTPWLAKLLHTCVHAKG